MSKINTFFRSTIWAIIFCGSVALFTPSAFALTLTQFRDCVGPNTGSYGYTCTLDAGTHLISSTIDISRNPGGGNTLLVQGTITTALGDTTLKRSSLGTNAIMQRTSSGGQVTIANFRFDGDRDTTDTCKTSNFPDDLELASSTGPTLVYYNEFIDAPGIAINSGAYSSFQYLSIKRARVFGIRLGTNNTYYSNYYEHTGTNAVVLDAGAYMADDYFYSNHDEFVFEHSGGQLWIAGIEAVGSGGGITVINGIFDGQNATATQGDAHAGSYGCPVPGTDSQILGNLGIEAYNTADMGDVHLISNSIWGHYWQGVLFRTLATGAHTQANGNIDITTYCGGACSAQLIASSAHSHGIDIQGNTTGSVTFAGVMSQWNNGYGISLAGSGYTATFSGNACLSNNGSGRVSAAGGVTVSGLPGSDTCPTH